MGNFTINFFLDFIPHFNGSIYSVLINQLWCSKSLYPICKTNVLLYMCRYMIDQMAENKGFIVDVKVSICFPLDDEKICIPTDEGLHLLKNEEIPVCDQRALVNFKSRYTDTTGDQWGGGVYWSLLGNQCSRTSGAAS